jgi:CRP/FNR family transcriptional regulator, cyclic AMP receptor protein
MAFMIDKPSEFRERLESQLKEWSLPKSIADDLADHLCPVIYEKGSVIFLRGSPADFLFCVLNGFAKLYLPHINGQRTLVALARPGDLLGFVDSLDSDNHRGQVFEAHALTKCSLGLVSRDYLIKLVRTLDSDSITRLLEHVNTTWSRMFEWYATFMGLSFRERLQHVLENLKVRVGINDRRGVLLLPALTHEDLAEMIGSSRPMVSRLINDMAEDGLLVRGEKQHYVLRAAGWPARADVSGLNERQPASRFYANGGHALPANDGSRDNAGVSSVSAVSLHECQSQRQRPRQSVRRASVQWPGE